MAENQVNIIVAVKDQATANLKSIADNVQRYQKEFNKYFDDVADQSRKAAVAFGAVGAAAGLFLKSTLDQAAGLEQTKVAFETMLGSAEKAGTFYKELTDFAKKTPFTLPGIEEAAKRLLAYGVTQREVIPDLKNLGNIAAGVGMDKMPQLILAFGQVRAASKLTGMELRQFSEAGVPLLGELAKSFGKSAGEIQDMVSDGKIGFKDVEAALASLSGEGGRFQDLMEKQSQTFNGMVSNLQDAWTLFLREAGQPLVEWGKQFVAVLLDFVKNGLPQLIAKIKESADWLMHHKEILAAIAGAITGLLLPAFLSLAAAIGQMVLALGPWAIAGAAIAALGYTIYQNWEKVKGLIPLITSAVTLLAAAFLTFNLPALAAGITTVAGAFLSAATAAGSFAAALLANPIGLILGAIGITLAALTIRIFEAQAAMGALANTSRESAAGFTAQAEALSQLAATMQATNPAISAYIQGQSEVAGMQANTNTLLADYADEMGSIQNVLLAEMGLQTEKASLIEANIERQLKETQEYQRQQQEKIAAMSMFERAVLTAETRMHDEILKLGQDEKNQRIKIAQEDLANYNANLKEKLANYVISNQERNNLQKEALLYEQKVLQQELAYTGTITDEKIAILKKYGMNEQAMRAAAASQDADMLRARLKMAADFHLKSAEQIRAFVAYTKDASNAELKIFADKLKKQDAAATSLRNRLAAIYQNPIIQNVVTIFTDSNMSVGEKIKAGTDALLGLPKLFGQAAGAVGDYAKQVGQIETNFGAARDAILAAGTGIENGYDKAAKGAGGAGAAVDKAAKEAEKALKEQQDAVASVSKTYEDMQASVSDSLFQLEQEHIKAAGDITAAIDKIHKAIDDLNAKYTQDFTDQNKGIAEKYVEQQQKVLDMQQKVKDAAKDLAAQDADPEKIAASKKAYDEAVANLAKEQKALDDNKNLSVEYADQIKEAQRRAGETEFERFLEDVQARKDVIQKEYEDKLAGYAQDLKDQFAQQEAEVTLYNDKLTQIQALKLQAARDHEAWVSDMTLHTKEGADKMEADLKRVLDMVNKIIAAKAQAGISQAVAPPQKFAGGGIVEGRVAGDSVPALLSPGEEVITRDERTSLARNIQDLLGAIKEGAGKPAINQNITQYIGNGHSMRSAADEQFFAARVAQFG